MWESPSNITIDEIETELYKRLEEEALKPVHRIGIDVDKTELIRALNYDRDQYNKGYQDAMDELVRCKDCINRNRYDCPYDIYEYGEPEDDDYCSRGVKKDGVD